MEGIEFLDYMPRKGMGVYGSLYLSVSMSLSLFFLFFSSFCFNFQEQGFI